MCAANSTSCVCSRFAGGVVRICPAPAQTHHHPLLPWFPVAAPKGFVPLKDSQDGYSFLYPFG